MNILLIILAIPLVITDKYEEDSIMLSDDSNTYIALQSDLILKYHLRSSQEESVVGKEYAIILHRYEKPIHTEKKIVNTITGTIVIKCGIVYQPGNYTVTMLRKTPLKDGLEVLSSTKIMVKVVEINVIGLEREFYETFMPIVIKLRLGSINNNKRLCRPFVTKPSSSYKSSNDRTFFELSVRSASGTYKIIMSKELPHWYNLKGNRVEILCNQIDHPATYRVRIKSGFEDQHGLRMEVIAEKFFKTIWNNKYNLDVPDRLIPCVHEFKVYYAHPTRCIKKRFDRIRIYALLKSNVSSPEAPAAGIDYIEENNINDGGALILPCQFVTSTSIYTHLCFKYISVSDDGSVYEVFDVCRSLDSRCLNGEISSKSDSCVFQSAIPATWSEWSSWSKCSCYESNKPTQTRRRICLSPIVRGHPSDPVIDTCEGRDHVTRKCVYPSHICSTQRPFLSSTNGPDGRENSEKSPLDKISVDSCTCGCELNISFAIRTQINSSKMLQSSTRICKDLQLMVWIIRTTVNSAKISLRFSFIDVSSIKNAWIVIRDGEDSLSPLMAFYSSSSSKFLQSEKLSQDKKPSQFTSSSSSIRIEFHVPKKKHLSVNRSVKRNCGFIASYNVIGLNIFKNAAQNDEKSFKMVTVYFMTASLALCALVTLLLFVYFMKKFRRVKLQRRFHSVESCPSERSCSSMVAVTPLSTPQLRKRLMREKLRMTSNLTHIEPEDYLDEARHLLWPSSSLSSSKSNQFERPVAAVAPQPCKSVVLRKNRNDRKKKRIERESRVPLAGSVSEFSVGGSSFGDDYEYDYYDIGGYYQAGSYFNANTNYDGWDSMTTSAEGDRIYEDVKANDEQQSEMVAMQDMTCKNEQSPVDV